jgi:hypothetical protein
MRAWLASSRVRGEIPRPRTAAAAGGFRFVRLRVSRIATQRIVSESLSRQVGKAAWTQPLGAAVARAVVAAQPLFARRAGRPTAARRGPTDATSSRVPTHCRRACSHVRTVGIPGAGAPTTRTLRGRRKRPTVPRRFRPGRAPAPNAREMCTRASTLLAAAMRAVRTLCNRTARSYRMRRRRTRNEEVVLPSPRCAARNEKRAFGHRQAIPPASRQRRERPRGHT